MMRLLCLGYGYCAQAFVARYRALFTGIAATVRRQEQVAAVESAGIAAVALTEQDDGGLASAISSSAVLLVSAGPDATGDPFVARVASALGSSGSGRTILYLSTVGVYGDHAGGWVSEETPPAPGSARSRYRLAAEHAWLGLAASSGA
ncbi:MAG TPA: NAD(P)-dependent oxidoreductase, partial [Beijerinckiaceae bacterium]|nr:NAD(P)-dependent oxidoreductase [Beijerinckiaceae bacterium]